MESKRINKYLSEVGFCSRRKADEYISLGRVYINDKVAELGSKVNMNDEIKVDGEIIQNTNKKRIYIAFNKPIGIECTGNPKVKDNIIDFINHKERLFTIGRIDKQSEGLILLTNNGDIVNNVLRAENKKEKEYMVWVNKNITQDFIEKMRKGVRIMGKMTKRCYVKRINDNRFKIVLTQGMNRQIRRMCSFFDYRVKSLIRTRVINIQLGNLRTGKFRKFSNNEIEILNNHLKKTK